jgi:hypothetical protein
MQKPYDVRHNIDGIEGASRFLNRSKTAEAAESLNCTTGNILDSRARSFQVERWWIL